MYGKAKENPTVAKQRYTNNYIHGPIKQIKMIEEVINLRKITTKNNSFNKPIIVTPFIRIAS